MSGFWEIIIWPPDYLCFSAVTCWHSFNDIPPVTEKYLEIRLPHASVSALGLTWSNDAGEDDGTVKVRSEKLLCLRWMGICKSSVESTGVTGADIKKSDGRDIFERGERRVGFDSRRDLPIRGDNSLSVAIPLTGDCSLNRTTPFFLTGISSWYRTLAAGDSDVSDEESLVLSSMLSVLRIVMGDLNIDRINFLLLRNTVIQVRA